MILGTFVVLWGVASGVDAGLETSEATRKARLLFVTSTSAALIASPFIGYLMDKGDRIISVSICMAIAAVGYCSMFFIDNVLDPKYLPLFALLGWGQQCAFFAATNSNFRCFPSLFHVAALLNSKLLASHGSVPA